MAEKKTETTPPAQQGDNGGGSMTKIEAVRRALKDLGKDTKPLAIQAYVRDKFHIEISADVASNYKKSEAKKAQGKPRKKGKKSQAATPEKAAPAQEQRSAPARTAPAGKKQEANIPLQEILHVSELVGQFGPEAMHSLIDAITAGWQLPGTR